MRRPAIASSAAALAALLFLAGCSSDDGEPEPTGTPTEASSEAPTDASGEPTDGTDDAADGNAPEDVAALEGITVEGEPGAEPTLSFEQPLSVGGQAAAVASPGDGETVEEGDLLLVDFIQVNGENGEVLDSTYEGESQPLAVTDDATFPALNDVLVGQQVGARVIFARPTQGPAAIMVLEVREARSRAEGAAVEPPEGLPAVTLAENGEPSIEPAGGEMPTELVASATIEGEGKAVEEGDYVIVNYSGWLWDGTPFDSSWERKSPLPFEAGAGNLIEGWDTGIIGHTVGSQVLFIIPPELGYGDQDQGAIPPGSTLVFVVDILYAG